MSLEQTLEYFQKLSTKRKWMTCWRHLPSQPARYAPFPPSLHPRLKSALAGSGITQLYIHQAQAFDLAAQGKNPVIVTPTASGKTLCYNLPVLNGLLNDPDQRALYIFPTKALAYDQLHELHRLRTALNSDFSAATYDGDSPAANRPAIRRQSSIVLTNPDMLHRAILPHHPRWQPFLSQLKYIIIDELHQYRGVFGSHLGNVLRRLLRICSFYGSSPNFILASATLANPRELACEMTGRDTALVNDSGAPSGEKVFIFYNPPLVNPMDWVRRSYLAETVEISKLFIEEAVQTIIFARSRINVEILLRELRRTCFNQTQSAPVEAAEPEAQNPSSQAEINQMIRGYRGGYLPRERRGIEQGLRQGAIRAVVATSALELGVDIGHLQVSILAGYPGTIASTWQRAGRAGRRDALSAAVFIASSAPLDQFVVRNPDYFFGMSPEHGLINPDNLLILLDHIRCAVSELPFTDQDTFGDNPDTQQFLSFLEEDGDVIRSADQWHYSGGAYPADRVSLRTVSPEKYLVVTGEGSRRVTIAEIDEVSAARLIFPGAVYLHEGNQYLVQSLDQEQHIARVMPTDCNYFTLPVEHSNVEILSTMDRTSDAHHGYFGEVKAHSQVTGYKKLKFHTMENIGNGVLDLPANDMLTNGFWIGFDMFRDIDLAGGDIKKMITGLLGALKAMHSIATVVLMSDPRDLGNCLSGATGNWSAAANHLGSVEISVPVDVISRDETVNLFIYDNYPGGIGLSEQLYKVYRDVVRSSYKLIRECDCRFGCPGCIGPINTDGSTAKELAERLIYSIIDGFSGGSSP